MAAVDLDQIVLLVGLAAWDLVRLLLPNVVLAVQLVLSAAAAERNVKLGLAVIAPVKDGTGRSLLDLQIVHRWSKVLD